MSDDCINVRSCLSEDFKPLVSITYKQGSYVCPIDVAKEYAISIFDAVGYAQAEAAIARSFLSKGFGKRRQQLSKDERIVTILLTEVRSNRYPLKKGVTAIYGFNTQQPLVEVEYPGLNKIQMQIDVARTHGSVILEACEASRFDSYWVKFAKSVDFTEEEAYRFTQDFLLFRQRLSLESKMQEGV